MVISVKPIQESERLTLSKIISDEIKEYIVTNDLKTGDRLPSERDLAATLNVSRVIVREALRRLEAIGIVQIRHGEGAFVNTEDPSTIFHHLLDFWKINQPRLDELLDLRFTLEKAAIEQVHTQGKNLNFLALEEIIQKMKETDNPKLFRKYDSDFHITIVQATNNALFLQLTDIIVQYFHDLPSLPYTEELKNTTVEEHIAIVEALKKGEQELAISILAKHLLRNKKYVQ